MGDIDDALNRNAAQEHERQQRELEARLSAARKTTAVHGPVRDRLVHWLDDLCVQYAAMATARQIPTDLVHSSLGHHRIWRVSLNDRLLKANGDLRVIITVYANGFWYGEASEYFENFNGPGSNWGATVHFDRNTAVDTESTLTKWLALPFAIGLTKDDLAACFARAVPANRRHGLSVGSAIPIAGVPAGPPPPDPWWRHVNPWTWAVIGAAVVALFVCAVCAVGSLLRA